MPALLIVAAVLYALILLLGLAAVFAKDSERTQCLCVPMWEGVHLTRMGKKFFGLYNSCRQKLARMHLETLKTFNLLSLVAARPQDQERQTALDLQRDREEKAHSEYKECSHGLFDQILRYRNRADPSGH